MRCQIKSRDKVSVTLKEMGTEKTKTGSFKATIGINLPTFYFSSHKTVGILTVSTNSMNRNANYLSVYATQNSIQYAQIFFFFIPGYTLFPDFIQFQLSWLLINLIKMCVHVAIEQATRNKGAFGFSSFSACWHIGTQKKKKKKQILTDNIGTMQRCAVNELVTWSVLLLVLLLLWIAWFKFQPKGKIIIIKTIRYETKRNKTSRNSLNLTEKYCSTHSTKLGKAI